MPSPRCGSVVQLFFPYSSAVTWECICGCVCAFACVLKVYSVRCGNGFRPTKSTRNLLLSINRVLAQSRTEKRGCTKSNGNDGQQYTCEFMYSCVYVCVHLNPVTVECSIRFSGVHVACAGVRKVLMTLLILARKYHRRCSKCSGVTVNRV